MIFSTGFRFNYVPSTESKPTNLARFQSLSPLLKQVPICSEFKLDTDMAAVPELRSQVQEYVDNPVVLIIHGSVYVLDVFQKVDGDVSYFLMERVAPGTNMIYRLRPTLNASVYQIQIENTAREITDAEFRNLIFIPNSSVALEEDNFFKYRDWSMRIGRNYFNLKHPTSLLASTRKRFDLLREMEFEC